MKREHDRYARREPCGNCPFRKDAPLAHWHPDEYTMLADIERTEGEFGLSRTFGCHKDRPLPEGERGVCVGWLLNQRARGVPSLGLRMRLATPALAEQMEQATGEADCFDSVTELVAANLRRDRELHPERYRRKRRGTTA